MPDDPSPHDRVFVYGTLRRGFVRNEATLAFHAGAAFLCNGWLPGGLYSLGWYPALVEGEPGEVRGEVWKLVRPGLMALLDAYEGIFEDGPPDFRRARRRVRIEAGRVDAWAYVHAGEVDPRRRIPSGDWADAVSSV